MWEAPRDDDNRVVITEPVLKQADDEPQPKTTAATPSHRLAMLTHQVCLEAGMSSLEAESVMSELSSADTKTSLKAIVILKPYFLSRAHYVTLLS